MLITCAHCGKDFNKTAKAVNVYRKSGLNAYCSLKCRHDAKTTLMILQCGRCGKPVTRSPSALAKSASGLVFCSLSCRTTVINGRLAPYAQLDWPAIKKFHDIGNSVESCMKHFRFSRGCWDSAVRHGLIIGHGAGWEQRAVDPPCKIDPSAHDN